MPLAEREPLYGSTRYRKIRDLNKCDARYSCLLRMLAPPSLYAALVARTSPVILPPSQGYIGVRPARDGP